LHKFNSEINEIEGIYQIKIDVPFAVKYVCVYLFRIEDKLILIDSGLNLGNWRKKFFESLEDLKINIRDIDYCFITHIHIDHIGLTKKLKEVNPNLKILMHDITYELLKWESNRANLKELKEKASLIAKQMIKYGISEEQGKKVVQFFTYWPQFLVYQKPDLLVHDGDIILNNLEVLWTPGHSFGHICIFDKKRRFLFSGDHILSRITPHIGNFIVNEFLHDKYRDFDFNNILKYYLGSLDKIDALNPRIIFPAHQEVIFNPHERILEIKEHHNNRLKEILDLIKQNPLSPFEISQIHFGTDLDEINSYMALSEVLGHLLYLEDLGKVKKLENDGKVRYLSSD
jgi:glyoxylase-like metal-dependent hydrolase (beta-lactamase superfamily II)